MEEHARDLGIGGLLKLSYMGYFRWRQDLPVLL